MSEIIVIDKCPSCGRNTIVLRESEDGFEKYGGCQFCDERLDDLPYMRREWLTTRYLTPERR